eukprot:5473172-Amphidinium_carterae.1
MFSRCHCKARLGSVWSWALLRPQQAWDLRWTHERVLHLTEMLAYVMDVSKSDSIINEAMHEMLNFFIPLGTYSEVGALVRESTETKH